MADKVIIGTCNGCGGQNTVIALPQFQKLVDTGVRLPICATCEERYIAHHIEELRRHPKFQELDESEKKAKVQALRAKVTDATIAATTETVKQ